MHFKDDGPYNYVKACICLIVRLRWTAHVTAYSDQDISKALTDAGAKGTFFFNGNNCESSDIQFYGASDDILMRQDGCIYAPEIIERVQYAFKDGHQVGIITRFHVHVLNETNIYFQIASHTWSHTGIIPRRYYPVRQHTHRNFRSNYAQLRGSGRRTITSRRSTHSYCRRRTRLHASTLWQVGVRSVGYSAT